MQARLEARKASPAVYEAMLGLETSVRKQFKLKPALPQLYALLCAQLEQRALESSIEGVAM